MTTSTPTIPIVFDNKTGQPVWIQFLNGAFGSDQFGANGAVALSGNVAFSLSQLTSTLPAFPELGSIPNVALNAFTNGRIYLNIGNAGLQGLGGGYQPAPNNSADKNYPTPYAYIELNVFGNSANNMDLSDIDFFSLAMEASTWKGGQMVADRAFTNPDPLALGKAMQDLAGLSNNQAVVNANGNIVRVNGPGLAGGYHDWNAYFAFLAARPAATMAGRYAGNGGSGTTGAQTYSLTATFGTDSVTLSGNCSVVGATTILITYADLNNQAGVYGANPPYSINGGAKTAGIVNDVYGWIVADLLTALNCGTLASPTVVDGKALGDYTSSEMFALAQKDIGLLFGGAQSNADYYNAYAGEIATLSPDIYGFPFSDRVQDTLLYFPPSSVSGGVDYLKITLLPIEYAA